MLIALFTCTIVCFFIIFLSFKNVFKVISEYNGDSPSFFILFDLYLYVVIVHTSTNGCKNCCSGSYNIRLNVYQGWCLQVQYVVWFITFANCQVGGEVWH